MPAGHDVHWIAPVKPGVDDHEPSGQKLQIEADPADHVPAAHVRQTEHPVAPQYVPAAHPGHSVQPLVPQYVPEPQFEHTTAPAAESCPGLQGMQVALLVAPSVTDAVPAGHAVQVAEPAAAYVPAPHVEHVAAPADENEPALQLEHTLLTVAPTAPVAGNSPLISLDQVARRRSSNDYSASTRKDAPAGWSDAVA